MPSDTQPYAPSMVCIHAQPEGRGTRWGPQHTNVGNLVCGWHPALWINDLNVCPRLFCHCRPQQWHKGRQHTRPEALWWPGSMNMRKWGRHPVNNSCHCAPQQAAEPGGGVGWRGALHDMSGPWHGTQTQTCHPCGNITLASTICALNTSVGTWQVLISPHWLFPLAVMPLRLGQTQHLVWVSVHDAAHCY